MRFRMIHWNFSAFAIPGIAARSLFAAAAAALCLCTAALAASDGVRVLGTGADDERPEIRVLEQSDHGLTLEFSLPTVLAEEITVDGVAFQSLGIPGGADRGEVGSPVLPTFARFVAIPARAAVQVTASVVEEEELSGYRLVPMQDENDGAFAWNREAYARDDFGAAEPVQVGAPALLRGLRVVSVTFSPVRANPAQDRIRIARRLRVEIGFSGEDSRNQAADLPPLTPSFDRMYREMVVNWESPAKAQGLQHGTWLVICKNDPAVTSRLQPLLDWRQRKGYPVRLATTAETGTTSSQIKSYIQNAYNTWSPPPEHVVLAGDASGTYSLPYWTSGVGEGDHPYVQLSGGDLLADAHIGRLSFETLGELDIIVDKTVSYESTPYMADTSWYTRACLVGDPSSSGYSVIQVMQWIKQRLLQVGYTDVDTIFGGSFVSQMTAALNQGDTFFAYRGYYQMSGWSNSNTYALSNYDKLSFGIMSTCGTGSFAGGTARSEGFLRAFNSSQQRPIGSVGAIGTATLSTHTRYNNAYTFGVFFGELYKDAWEMGAAHSWGKANLFLNYNDADPGGATNFSYWNNLMGDPACEIFTGVPQALGVSHPATLPVGTNSVTVTVTQGGPPCEGALVALYQASGGSGDLFATGTTDEQGQVELAIPPAWAGTMKLTVTKHNAIPYLADVAVSNPTLFVAFQAASVDDDASGQSSGDGDGVINPGETIELALQLKNFGSQGAANVSATLTTEDPYVTLGTVIQSFGAIAAGATAWSAGSYTFSVDPGCPHDHVLRFGCDVTSGANQWHSVVELETVSADFTYGTSHFYNAGGNGLLDPGETVDVSVSLRNDGQIPAESPVGTLYSLSEYVDVITGVRPYPTILPGAAQENVAQPFAVRADAGCPNGYQARMKLVMQFSGAIVDTVFFNLAVGTRTATDPIGPDAYGYWAYDNTDVAYPEAPVYGWIEIDPNLGGSGTQVTLGDYGDYQDKSRTVNLPFPFTHYGQTFTTATICSNGWVQMGNTWMTDYRNWTLPSPGGPDGAIAAFWDDLIEVSNPAGHVYQWYDAANHRWIVEWSRMRNIVNSLAETFQAIFYDPAFHPTDTGDGKITFQYSVVNVTDSTDGYCTVGIESPDNSMGLTYTYFNRYPTGAPTLPAGRAITFIPKRETLTGVLQGTVTNQDDGGAPLGAAVVTVLENGHEYLTNAGGAYEGIELPGLYTLVASRAGFQPDTAQAISVTPGGATQVDFSLHDILAPAVNFIRRPSSTTDSLTIHAVEASVTDFSPLEEVTLYYRIYDGAFQQLSMGSGGSPTRYYAEIPAQIWTTRVDWYVYARDGGDNVSLMPSGAPGEVYTFWVGPLLTAYANDFEAPGGGWTAGAPGDNATSGVWVQADPNATFHDGSVMVQPEDDHTPEPGVSCWVTGNAPAGSGEDVNDVDGGVTTLVSPRLDLTIDGTVLLRYWRWYSNDTGAGAPDDAWLVQASDDDGASWTDLEEEGTSARAWTLVEIDLGQHVTLNDQVRVRFRAADAGAPSIVEAAVDDIEIVYIGLTPSAGPDGVAVPFGFAANNANPLRPGAAIRFGLERAGLASLVLYDVQGRAVRRLLGGPLPAGAHTIAWDGRDDRGSLLPSGVYFYRLEAAEGARHRKVLLVR